MHLPPIFLIYPPGGRPCTEQQGFMGGSTAPVPACYVIVRRPYFTEFDSMYYHSSERERTRYLLSGYPSVATPPLFHQCMTSESSHDRWIQWKEIDISWGCPFTTGIMWVHHGRNRQKWNDIRDHLNWILELDYDIESTRLGHFRWYSLLHRFQAYCIG